MLHCDYVPQKLKCIKPLFKNPSYAPLHMSQHQEPTSECQGKIVYELTTHVPPDSFL